MDATGYFKDKKITVMGLGLLGRGVGDIQFLASQGADLIVTDLKSREELQPSLDALKRFSNISFTLGEHKKDDFRDRDLVLKAPKTPIDSIYVAEAVKNGIQVTMSTALFARLALKEKAALIGVTGTRGKTTTTQMIAHILRESGKRVMVGGNIQGVSTLALLPQVTGGTYVVLELDSWQLQGFRAEKISPHIAVFTNLYPDHMDYYNGDRGAYLKDKAEIFLHQDADDVLVVGEQIAKDIQETYGAVIASKIIVATTYSETLSVPGGHNRANAACAAEVAGALGIAKDDVHQALASFGGVSGRLELVRETEGVRIYNDTTSTTPEATIAGLRALGTEKKNIILIMGGADKGLTMSALVDEIPKYVKRIILLSGSGTNAILPLLPDASVFAELTSAVAEAVSYARAGDIILFSPAFASFGMFKNEYDRGDQFTALVNKL